MGILTPTMFNMGENLGLPDAKTARFICIAEPVQQYGAREGRRRQCRYKKPPEKIISFLVLFTIYEVLCWAAKHSPQRIFGHCGYMGCQQWLSESYFCSLLQGGEKPLPPRTRTLTLNSHRLDDDVLHCGELVCGLQ
jgi:hypothetical protein